MKFHNDYLLCWLLIFFLKNCIITDATIDPANNISNTIFLKRNVRASPENICKAYCKCVSNNSFLTANCDFLGNQEYKFNSQLEIPQTVTQININLGSKTKLLLEETVLNSISINHIAIKGTYFHDKQSTSGTVYIYKNAFQNLKSPLPEVIVTNVENLFLKDFAFTSIGNRREFILQVADVKNVLVESKVFHQTTFHAQFESVGDLQLNENAFSGASPHSKVAINKSYIRQLVKIGVSLKELKIENSELSIIKSNAIDVNTLDSFILRNNKIEGIESNAITEKVLARHVAVINCDINTLEARAFNGFGTVKFTFDKNRINRINEYALNFVGVHVLMSDNKIKKVENNWFKCAEWNNITISNNTFGEFQHMLIDNTKEKNKKCVFHHNLITFTSDESFKTIKTQCRLTDLIFYKECNCKFDHWLKQLFANSLQSASELVRESNCRIDDTLKWCFKSEIIKFQQYHDRICSNSSKSIDCKKPIDKPSGIFIKPYELNDDGGWKQYIVHTIVGIACVVITVIMVVCLSIRNKSSCYKHPTENEDESNTTNISSSHYTTELSQHHATIHHASLRSMKTFSHKDHLIIKRTLDKMKEKQPVDKYELVYNNTKRLLNETLNEYEKVRIIGDIVQVIGECENSGEDFVAFTDILYKHLAPDSRENVTEVPQPIQLEPEPQPNNDETLYAEPVLYNQQNQTDQTKIEHIYAELANSRQQQSLTPLLLTNNYSSPLDNNDLNTNEYSEPIGIAKNFNIKNPVSPYAISDDIQQPCTSKNLPDILNSDAQIKAGPSEINRINRSPRTNRKIPEYTVPATQNKKPFRITDDAVRNISDDSSQNSTSSDHSGGSGATIKIDDLILYADIDK